MTHNGTLRLRRFLKASKERVFEAFANSDIASQWMSAGSAIYFKKAGRAKVSAYEAAGAPWSGDGSESLVVTYRDLVPCKFLSFSWRWSDSLDETLVTIALEDGQDGTELLLEHCGYVDRDSADWGHQGWLGWTNCFEKLEQLLSAPDARRLLVKDFARRLVVRAPRERVFDALSSLSSIRGWWLPDVSGSTVIGSEFTLKHYASEQQIRLRVEEASRPSLVQWLCRERTDFLEWFNTRLTFELINEASWTELRFQHKGLRDDQICYEPCASEWDLYLSRLVSFIETGDAFRLRDKPA